MQKALFIIQTSCRGMGLSVKADNTSMVLFTNNRKLVGFKKPILFRTKLQLKNQVKYLGVILDEKLNWNSHMSKSDRKNMGTETKSCVLDVVVRPILTYAALLWWKKTSQISANRKTAHLQRLA
jgi:hypothetical protein